MPARSPSGQSFIRNYRKRRYLTDAPRGVKVIDAFGLSAEQIDNHRKRVWGILPLRSNRGQPKTPEALGREWPVTDFGGFMRAPAIPARAHPQADVLGGRATPKHEAAQSVRRAELGSEPHSAPPVPAARNLTLTGTIRWLRPEFQNPEKSLSKQELPAQVQQALDVDFPYEKQSQKDSNNEAATVSAAATQSAGAAIQAWIATLPERCARMLRQSTIFSRSCS